MQRQVYFVYLYYILSSVWCEMGFGLHDHSVGTSEMSNLVLTLHLITINIQLHLRFLIITFAKLYVKMQLKFFFFFFQNQWCLSHDRKVFPLRLVKFPTPREILYNGDSLWAARTWRNLHLFAVLLFS